MPSVHESAVDYWMRAMRPELARLRFREICIGGVTLVDAGVQVVGGLEGGRRLGTLCLAGLADVELVPASLSPVGLGVQVTTDQAVSACLASQYAGWPISVGDYFAMGSGPFRASRGREPMLESLGLTEAAERTVGILESRRLPDEATAVSIARSCGVAPEGLTLLVAPTASLAGMVQIVARSVETCLHKLHELHFPLARIVSARGFAPLPPSAGKDRVAMGWTNDAILYGGQVTLWVDGRELDLSEYGRQVPSSASADYGRPFAEIFEAAGRDFYRIDPLLFSPAQVTLVDVSSGKVLRFGDVSSAVLGRSFGVAL